MSNYRMRAWHTVLTDYVLWISTGSPDPTGSSSGYTPGELAHIAVKDIIPTSGTAPGTAGGEWFETPMDLDPYTPPSLDMDAADNFSQLLTADLMAEYP